MGQDTRFQATERSESPHQSPHKRTQCMRRNKATPGAREECHFLFEESVREEETAEEGGTDWWRLLREWDLSEPVRNAPCFCLLKRETELKKRREEKRGAEKRRRNERRDGTDQRGEAVRRERV